VTAPAAAALTAVPSRKRTERLTAILDFINERRSVSLTELTGALDISPATARRDLTELADQRLIARTHGGARVLDGEPELPMALRDTRFPGPKHAIAQAMAARLPAGRYVVALSGGTTTAAVAREVANRRDLTVVTNSLTIANQLASSAVRVVVTGGFLRPQSLELVGIVAENTFNAVNVGTAVLGADGVTASAGVTTHDETEARTNHAMVGKAQRTVVVADGSKVGRVALAQMAEVGQVAMLITDRSADPAELELIRAAGVEVVIAD
jgi:DeoR family transcriptional regulator, aga operon transcriptional repressor